MTQIELINKCFTEKGRITNADFAEHFQHFTGRNRVTEAATKKYWAAKGFTIQHFFGKTWKDNGWEIVAIPKEPEGQTIKAACHKCGNVFEARLSNVKAGFGRFCSRRCAGGRGGKRRAELASLARAQIGVQVALL